MPHAQRELSTALGLGALSRVLTAFWGQPDLRLFDLASVVHFVEDDIDFLSSYPRDNMDMDDSNGVSYLIFDRGVAILEIALTDLSESQTYNYSVYFSCYIYLRST